MSQGIVFLEHLNFFYYIGFIIVYFTMYFMAESFHTHLVDDLFIFFGNKPLYPHLKQRGIYASFYSLFARTLLFSLTSLWWFIKNFSYQFLTSFTRFSNFVIVLYTIMV